MDLNIEPIDKKKRDISKMVNELVRLNFAWWKNQGDPAIYEAFCTRLNELGSESIEVAESCFLQLNFWAKQHGYEYQRLHRFQIRLLIAEVVIDIKVNDYDYEFYLLVNDKPRRLFKNPADIEPWIENELLPSLK
ncbi:hypothetical protein SAMN05720606_101106 [Paenibacillus polysaccharolyticus]|uniref:Uncharacterized protein n=1 Tax=Paenibacillus polysaccharolyticus TaxID=582692 RepID=A0A1G5AU71_9BACL|nr:hypothetical protein [Paenibacillus polysaccharolyticus]SCX81416.1 hypothetical protein SAMN05720606_101106 [Paenibacillus polysaccharolyticus]